MPRPCKVRVERSTPFVSTTLSSTFSSVFACGCRIRVVTSNLTVRQSELVRTIRTQYRYFVKAGFHGVAQTTVVAVPVEYLSENGNCSTAVMFLVSVVWMCGSAILAALWCAV